MTELESVYQELSNHLQSLRKTAERGPINWGAGVSHVYDPISYAWGPMRLFLERMGGTPKGLLFLGMNPGPWGMTQTGVPFGNVEFVRRWLKIEGPVGKPENEHPARPVDGFDCTRREVSGQRFWSLMERRFRTPEVFFEHHAVHSFCPLVFMDQDGRNVTPDKLSPQIRGVLEAHCQEALTKLIDIWQPSVVACLGQYAWKQASSVLASAESEGHKFHPFLLPHPSPINPASHDWENQAERLLVQANVWPATPISSE